MIPQGFGVTWKVKLTSERVDKLTSCLYQRQGNIVSKRVNK